MNWFTMIKQQWRQRWRLPEVRLMLLALALSVTAVTAVGFVTDRIIFAMMGQATELQGGDLVLTSARPPDPGYLQKAQSMGLATATVTQFPSMVVASEKLQLAQVKVVSSNYPLKGALKIRSQSTNVSSAVGSGPAVGNAWVDPRLSASLDLLPGNVVELGKNVLNIDAIVTQMPDQGVNAFQFAPVIVINEHDLEATGLLTAASRARFLFLFAGEPETIERYTSWLKAQLKVTERIRTLEDGMPAVQQALERAQGFLGLAALLSVILAGAAIALTSHSLGKREAKSIAILKTLGATQKELLWRLGQSQMLLVAAASLIGIFAGFLIQFLLGFFIRQWIQTELPLPGITPALVGIGTAFIMTLGFSTPFLFRQISTAPMNVLQDRPVKHTVAGRVTILSALGGVYLLMWLQSHDLKLSLIILVATVIAIGLFTLTAIILLRLLKYIARRYRNTRHLLPADNARFILLLVIFGTGFFSLLHLTSLRTDLIQRWSDSLPTNAPNHFLVNIQPEERETFSGFAVNKQISADLYPMTRGRLVAINANSVGPDDYTDDRAKRLLEREFNLSSTARLSNSNKIVAGQWFSADTRSGLSVEEDIAKTLGFGLGDRLQFDIAGQRITEQVTSIRKVRWDSMEPNFFVITAPGLLEDLPKTFITSIYIPTDRHGLIPQLIDEFPGVTVIDISAIMQQVRGMIDKASLAVQSVFSMTLIAGLLVLYAALQSQRRSRQKEIAILKSLGARKRQIRTMLIFEFSILGGLSGLVAAIFSIALSNYLAWFLFEMEPAFNPGLIAFGSVAGAVLVGAAGYLNVRPLLRVPPILLLNQSAR
jgi:putative ABC transport system permease protein